MKNIALIGNPNSGKTTVFNKLTGSSQKVGNWAGVTVEKKEGKLRNNHDIHIMDLPGIYSLSPYSPEEKISRDYITVEKPDMIVNVVDASNIERNLYLTTQVMEFGIPTIIVLNMMDSAKKNGITIDVQKLSDELGCPVIETVALKGEGIDKVISAIVSGDATVPKVPKYSDAIEKYISIVDDEIGKNFLDVGRRWSCVKVLENDELVKSNLGEDSINKVDRIIVDMERELEDDGDSIITNERYGFIEKVVDESVVKKIESKHKMTMSDKIDKVVTNRWLGLPIFILVMAGVFYLVVETIGAAGTDWLNGFFEETIVPAVESTLEGWGTSTVLIDLVAGGIIGGVGAVLGFLPQMLVMFLLLSLMEQCGYMARVAFVLDRIFRKFGLSGKSVLPILVGYGCSVPGIMASRTIESESDRRITAMTVSFFPCGAKLPVISLIAGALFGQAWWVALSIYLVGILMILLSGIILKKWKSLSGKPEPFLMELPAYHLPTILETITSTLKRGWAFVVKAGTIIVAAAILIWFLTRFDWSLNYLSEANIDDSIMASLGNALRYLFVPLGFGDSWEFSVATITGLIAKENILATFGIIFSGSADMAEASLWEAVAASFGTGIAGYSFLLFNMICAPCFAAIGAIHSELGSWKDTGKAVLYQTLLAYTVALVFYQFALLFTGSFSLWIIVAVLALAALIYCLVAKDPFAVFEKIKCRGC